MEKGKNIICYILNVCVAITVLSQTLEYNNIIRPIMFILWIVLFIKAGLDVFFKFTATLFHKIMILMTFFVVVECIIFGLIKNDSNYLLSNTVMILLIPLFIYTIALILCENSIQIDTRSIIIVYCTSTLLLSVYMAANILPSFSAWMKTETYIYSGKNSVAQIMCSSVILIAMLYKPLNLIQSIIKWIYMFGIIIIVLLFQCRTAIVATTFCLFVYLFSIKNNSKTLIVKIGMVAIILSLIFNSETFRKLLIHALFLDKYQNADLDKFSSGRITYYIRAMELFDNNMLTGVGTYYVDNLYINALTTLGLIGGIPVIIIWVSRIIININRFREMPNDSIYRATMLLSCFYFIESLFEAYPPFGPGTCSFVFWLFCGFADVKYYRIRDSADMKDKNDPMKQTRYNKTIYELR